jgi:hypothetical protein
MKFKEIISRIIEETGMNKTQIAKQVYNITLNNLSGRLNSNRILFKQTIKWALHNNLDPTWILTGKRLEKSQINTTGLDSNSIERLNNVAFILRQRHPLYTTALEQNIDAFHTAVKNDIGNKHQSSAKAAENTKKRAAT